MAGMNLNRWREHLAAVQREGKSISQYAREHGLSRYTLYAARQQLKDEGCALAKGGQPGVAGAVSTSPFVAVEVEARIGRLRIRLPNAVEVELIELEPSAYASLMKVLAALPCSG